MKANHPRQVGFPGGACGKEPCLPMQEKQEMWVRSLGWEDPLEEGMATHCSILAWRIPWTDGPGGLQSIELQRVKTGLKCLSTPHTRIQERTVRSEDGTLRK